MTMLSQRANQQRASFGLIREYSAEGLSSIALCWSRHTDDGTSPSDTATGQESSGGQTAHDVVEFDHGG